MDVMLGIRERAATEELDYLFLMDALSQYKQPRDKLTKLLKTGALTRIKKGLYLFGPHYQRRPYSLEMLANLIYGPSYLSFEYALAYYSMIPERVTRITSATCKRSKTFKTVVGDFVYHSIDMKKYAVGVTWESIDDKSHFLLATREKAISDLLYRRELFDTAEEMLTYLTESMRIDEKDLFKLKHSLVSEIAACYKNRNVDLLCEIVKK